MANVQIRKVYCPLGIVIFLLSLISLALAGTSVGISPYSQSQFEDSNSVNYTSYSSGLMKTAFAIPTTDARSAHDHNGRTLILKSLILAPLALVVFILLLILFIPIPVISTPLGRSISTSPYNRVELMKQVFTSEECVERMSCELTRLSRSYETTAWIPRTVEKLLLGNGWSEKIIRGMKATNPACRQFTCSPAKALRRSLKLQRL